LLHQLKNITVKWWFWWNKTPFRRHFLQYPILGVQKKRPPKRTTSMFTCCL